MFPRGRITRRVLQIVPTLILVTVAVFLMVRLLPGDPVTSMLGDRGTPAAIARLRSQMGLDGSVVWQFWSFIRRLAQGDLGESVVRRVSVSSLIADRLPVTLYLTAFAGLLAVVLAVPLAFVAAVFRDRWPDLLIRGLFQIGLSAPVFYVGLLLLGFFAARWHLFPVGGMGDGFFDSARHLFLPALTLALSLSAILMRNLRSAIVGVLRADYIGFARAKGLSPVIVLGRHVLRNALVSAVALFGLNIGTLLGGAIVTEYVFAVPGVGALMIESITGRDYPVVQGMTLVLAVLVSLVFLATDLIETRLDPRSA